MNRSLAWIAALAVTVFALCASALPCAAQTAAERAACKPDAQRLCSAGTMLAAALGDRQYIYACFAAHRRELSKACDRVLKSHGY